MSTFGLTACACRSRADHLHLGGSLFEDSRRQPADDLELIAVANGHRLGPQGQHRQRPPQPRLAARQLERPRHDADDEVLFAVNRELLAEYRLGRAELFPPEASLNTTTRSCRSNSCRENVRPTRAGVPMSSKNSGPIRPSCARCGASSPVKVTCETTARRKNVIEAKVLLCCASPPGWPSRCRPTGSARSGAC